MANLIQWSPDTPQRISAIQSSLDAIEEQLSAIHSQMEALNTENKGDTTTQMYESHLALNSAGRQHVATVRDHAANTLKAYEAAQEQDTSNSSSVALG